MVSQKLLVAVTAVSLIALPAMAQTGDKQNNGHHYQGGPKTEVPHHMGKKGTVSNGKSGTHHDLGRPKTEVPHHMGEKQ